jgi:exopolyphosphatase/guanosine-5'-triphosphate,3'-diphosphate pyrophosphatase
MNKLVKHEAATEETPAVAEHAYPSHLTGESLRLAAIDVGSNSIHMIVAQIDPDGGVTTLWRMKEPVGLGRLSFPNRRITRDAMDRGIAALGRFKHAAQTKQAMKVIAVATSAVREAINGGDLIEKIWRELRLRVRVVSAREEARLIYLGARHGGCFGDKPDEPGLLLDIGGGSAELIVGTNERAMVLESRKLGAARMTSRFITQDPPDEGEVERLRKHYRKTLDTIVRNQVAPLGPVRAVGTSGTLENVAAMCAAMQKNADPRRIEAVHVDKLVKQMLQSTGDERAAMPGLDRQRKDQIVAGVVLVQELFSAFDRHSLDGVKSIDLCGGALREGILIDYVERKLPKMQVRREVPDPRRRSVLDLCRRCEWHKEHSQQVTLLALQIFDELAGLHGLGPLDRELLEYAGLMHDVGWHIGGKGHHRHSAYLVRHGRLKGFSPEEVEVMALVARYHRKKGPPEAEAEKKERKDDEAYFALSSRARRSVDVLAAILRVADGLDRSHADVVQAVTAAVKRKSIRLTLDARADAQLEVWGAERKADVFERVFGRSLKLEVA